MNFSERMVMNGVNSWLLWVNSSCDKCQEKWQSSILVSANIMSLTPQHKIKIKINNI